MTMNVLFGTKLIMTASNNLLLQELHYGWLFFCRPRACSHSHLLDNCGKKWITLASYFRFKERASYLRRMSNVEKRFFWSVQLLETEAGIIILGDIFERAKKIFEFQISKNLKAVHSSEKHTISFFALISRLHHNMRAAAAATPRPLLKRASTLWSRCQ